MNRAYALLTVEKAVEDADARVIRGTATTPEPDRIGDVVEPLGMSFTNPLPLLHQHRHDEPVGTVKLNKPTKEGITFEARLAKIDEPGPLKDRVDTAWGEIKAGLIRAVSIGFRTIEHAFLDDSNGIRFIKAEILELSLVTVPANASATITEIRSIDSATRAALGRERAGDRGNPAGASARTKPVKLLPKEGTAMKTIAEQIAGFKETRTAKAAEMEAIIVASGEKGLTLDAAEKTKYDDLEAEVKSLTEHIERLERLEATKASTAVTIKKIEGAADGSQSRDPQRTVVSQMKETLPKGIEFVRYFNCLATAKGDPGAALANAQLRYPDMHRIHNVLKAAVAAGTTTDATWAGNLVDYVHLSGDFIDFLRPETIIGKFGQNGIPALTAVPFNIQVPRQTGDGDGYWVGEGAPKPVTSFTFDNLTMRWAKVAAISALSQELVRFSNPSAEMLVRKALSDVVIKRIDIDFVDPSKAEVSNVSPASITNGVSAIASSGTDSEAVYNDLRALLQSFINSNLKTSRGVFIMSESNALGLSLMRNALGQPEFPGISDAGGTLLGRRVITSQYMGGIVIFMIPEEIYLADDGQVVIDASREASLQMDSAPTISSATPTATTVVSMWQTNSIAFRAERIINWKRRRDTAVAWLDDVDWGTASGSDA